MTDPWACLMFLAHWARGMDATTQRLVAALPARIGASRSGQIYSVTVLKAAKTPYGIPRLHAQGEG